MRALKEACRNQVAVRRSDDRERGGGERTLRGVLSTAIILHGAGSDGAKMGPPAPWKSCRSGSGFLGRRMYYFWVWPINRFSLQLFSWAVKASARIHP